MNDSVKTFTPDDNPTDEEFTAIAKFLKIHLDKYGDSLEDIKKAMTYALTTEDSFGGVILAKYLGQKVVGAVVLNKTGMVGYIPENILVYIAVHSNYRGKGIGKELMKTAINLSEGNIALHVDADNPAKFLYEKIGFAEAYVEMRYKAEEN